MKIVYVGPLWEGSTCLMRMQAMIALGHTVIPVDTEPPGTTRNSILSKISYKLGYPIDHAGINALLLKIVRENADIDMIWVTKGLVITSETLIELKLITPRTILAHYNPDDPFGAIKPGWKVFLKAAPFYDVHFVPRDENLNEYKKLGCKNVFRFWRSCDPLIHRPMEITKAERLKYGGPVGFIGNYEKERADSIKFLADNGIKVRIWGPNWNKMRSHYNVISEGKPLWGEDYTKAICSFDITLGFLRKSNRDKHTSRSVEIPATGSFMLAERTDEHLALFKERKEAEYFSSNQELLRKVKYYLDHTEERKRIAAAGFERCVSSKYYNYEVIRSLLEYISLIKNV